MTGITITAALTEAGAKIDLVDARMLLMHALGVDRAHLIAHATRVLTPAEYERYAALVTTRASGKPVAQLIGVREFYGRVFRINEHVLIPRPETEMLVELVLARLSSTLPSTHVLELGTGSGAIAISVALEVPGASVVATDLSDSALALAHTNAMALGATRIQFVKSNWYAALAEQRFGIVVSNPPYIAANDPHLSEGDLRFEPIIALTDQSADGLASLRHIIRHAPQHLDQDGMLMLEHGYDQGPTVAALFRERGYTNVQTLADHAGHPRITHGQWSLPAVKSSQS